MSVYKVVDIIGTSTESWEDAGLTAVKKARETIRNLRAMSAQLATEHGTHTACNEIEAFMSSV